MTGNFEVTLTGNWEVTLTGNWEVTLTGNWEVTLTGNFEELAPFIAGVLAALESTCPTDVCARVHGCVGFFFVGAIAIAITM